MCCKRNISDQVCVTYVRIRVCCRVKFWATEDKLMQAMYHTSCEGVSNSWRHRYQWVYEINIKNATNFASRSLNSKYCLQFLGRNLINPVSSFYRKSMNKVNQSGKKIQSVSGKVKEVLPSSPQFDSVWREDNDYYNYYNNYYCLTL